MTSRDDAKIGTTLSQKGLSIRFERSPAWVRSEGDYVTGFVRASPKKASGHYETWARMEFSSRRCAGYKRVS